MSLIEQALAIAGEGYPVFPCDRRKRPCWSNEELSLPPGEGGLKIATTDPDRIPELFAHPRAALIGVPTGEASGLAVVDVDVKDGKAGQDWYDAHQADLGLTRWHKTKSGGIHLVYAINGFDPGCNAGVIHDGVDLRGGGGYVIWWPAHDCEYGDVELAPFPEWIARETEVSAEAWATLAEDDLEAHITNAESFHQPMVSLAWRMANDGYSANYIRQHLGDVFDKSAGADPKHPRHKDWTRRKLDIFRTVASAVEKAGRDDQNETVSLCPKTETDQAAAENKDQPKPATAPPAISDYPGTRFDGKPPPELRMAIEGLVPAGRLCNVAGPGGAGKGILFQTAATCIADGLSFLGKDTIPGPVAYYSCEDDDDVLHHRQARINELLGLSAAPDGLFIKSYLGHDLTMYDGKRWKPPFDWLWDDLAKIEGLAVAILDPASEFYIGEFADPVAVKAFCKRLDAECVARNVTLFLLMHTPKGDANTAFGSVQWTNAARTTLGLTQRTNEEGAPDRSRAVLRVLKGNYVQTDEIPLTWTDDGLLIQEAEPDAYDKITAARALEAKILEMCAVAWKIGVPLSDSPQARDRYLPAKLRQATEGRFTKKEVIEKTSELLLAGKLKVQKTNNRYGLKVVGNDE